MHLSEQLYVAPPGACSCLLNLRLMPAIEVKVGDEVEAMVGAMVGVVVEAEVEAEPEVEPVYFFNTIFL